MTNNVSNCVGYVSDENYLAIAGVRVEFEGGGRVTVIESAPSGALYADLPRGEYRVTLCKSGFGSKRSFVEVQKGKHLQFRLLSDNLYGYAWPKWARSGEMGEVRVHSPEPYHASLWR